MCRNMFGRRRVASRISVTILVGVLSLLHGMNALAAMDSSVPVGIIRILLPENSRALVSMPFVPFNNSLETIFADQFYGNIDPSASDQVLLWITKTKCM